jgi:glucosyl-dolichyl phosphate glucuronosyltransferase
MKELLLSVVVASYTEKRAKDVLELLGSIEIQTYPNIETILVIEKSERLFHQVSSYVNEKGFNNVRIFFSPKKLGISKARNLGIKNAKGEIITLVDDDAVPFPNWAEEIVETFIQHDAAIGVVGPALPLWENKSMAWFPEEFYWIIGCTASEEQDKIREVRYAWGVNMSFRKEAFNTCLFKDSFSEGAHEEGKLGPVGDDREFALSVRRRTGRPIIYNPRPRVWHKVGEHKIKPRYIRRYAYWQGYDEAMFKKAYGDAYGRLMTEHEHFRRVLLKLPPKILKDFFLNPRIAFKKLLVTTEALAFISLGYASFIFPRVGRLAKQIV